MSKRLLFYAFFFFLTLILFNSGVIGRCRVLSTTRQDFEDRDTWYSVKRGSATLHALELAGSENGNLVVCRGARWKVCIYNSYLVMNKRVNSAFRIVASLVRAQPLQFFLNILRWLLVAVPATWTNSWLSYIQNKLAIAYRTRLTQEVMKNYLDDENSEVHEKVYYKLCGSQEFFYSSNLLLTVFYPWEYSKSRRQDKESRSVSYNFMTLQFVMADVMRNRMITHDIQRFSTHLAAIYANLAKPVLDVTLYNYQLSQNVGAEGLLGMIIFVQSTAALRRFFS